MSAPTPIRLDDAALALFARKGLEAGGGAPQVGESNAAKVRRILQLTADLAAAPLSQLRILDAGCGDGVYAIEAALHGADVVAIDARTERMALGAAVAERHGLTRLRFVHGDIRHLADSFHDAVDVVWMLGLLYHLDDGELFETLAALHARCRRLLVIDTILAAHDADTAVWRGQQYRGERVREHDDDDAPEVRRSRLLRSIDRTFAFRLTRASLIALLRDLGCTSVYETVVPVEPDKAPLRQTFAAIVGQPITVHTYPWINGLTDDDLTRRLVRVS